MTTMYSKIAFKNVKKSLKDYTIYFLTLTLAVCIFYSFNSIESQKAFIVAIAAMLFIIIRRLVFGDPVAGWASTVVIILFFKQKTAYEM